MFSRLKEKLVSQPPLHFDDLENIISSVDDESDEETSNNNEQNENITMNKIFKNQSKEVFTKRNPTSDRSLDIGKFKVFSSFGVTKTDSLKSVQNTENVHPNRSNEIERKTSFNKLFASTVEEHQRKKETTFRDSQPCGSVGDIRSRQLNNDNPTAKKICIGIEQRVGRSPEVIDVIEDFSCGVDHEQDDLEMIFSKVRHNRIDYIEQIMQEESFSALRTDRNGNTMLHVCAQNNNRKIASLLLDSAKHVRSNINAVNLKGLTSLDYAEKYGFEKLAIYLVGKGAHKGNQTSQMR
jgi:ankyrin repeat protein